MKEIHFFTLYQRAEFFFHRKILGFFATSVYQTTNNVFALKCAAHDNVTMVVYTGAMVWVRYDIEMYLCIYVYIVTPFHRF